MVGERGAEDFQVTEGRQMRGGDGEGRRDGEVREGEVEAVKGDGERERERAQRDVEKCM